MENTPTPESKPQKDKVVAALLALFLGGLGIHRFYLGHNREGFLYLIFFWTYIPAIIGIIDAIVYATAGELKWKRICSQ